MITYILEGAVKNCTIDFERKGKDATLSLKGRACVVRLNLLNVGGASQ